MTIQERIQIIVNEIFNGNKNQFAKAINEPPTSINNILGVRQSIPSAKLLESIVNSIENINTDWLLTGEGNMLNSDAPTKESSDNKEYNNDSFSARELLNIIHDLTTQGKQNAEANERNSRNIESLIALLAKSLKQELDEKRESELDENKNSA